MKIKNLLAIVPCVTVAIMSDTNASNVYPTNDCSHAFDFSKCEHIGNYSAEWQCRDYCEEWLRVRGKPLSTDTNNSSHVITTEWQMLEFTTCPDYFDYDTFVDCHFGTIKYEYKCATGYYGDPTSSTSGCTVCPANATCNEGSRLFACNIGYYQNGTSCSPCPSSGGIAGKTKSIGATSITECYIPANTSITDSDGQYIYISDCYYTK